LKIQEGKNRWKERWEKIKRARLRGGRRLRLYFTIKSRPSIHTGTAPDDTKRNKEGENLARRKKTVTTEEGGVTTSERRVEEQVGHKDLGKLIGRGGEKKMRRRTYFHLLAEDSSSLAMALPAGVQSVKSKKGERRGEGYRREI